jgi:hypothetical protein
MESNTKNVIMIDYVELDTNVRKNAEEYLSVITEDSFRAFAESTRSIAKIVLEKFYFAVDELYSEGPLKFQDTKQLAKFSDFCDGYRSKMINWANEHEIMIQEMKVTPSLKYPELSDIETSKLPLTIGGIGTVVAVGLCIFTDINTWVVVVAEILVLATTIYTYKKATEHRNEEYENLIKKHEIRLQEEKQRLINGVISDLKVWLKTAEEFSEKTLASFGI